MGIVKVIMVVRELTRNPRPRSATVSPNRLLSRLLQLLLGSVISMVTVVLSYSGEEGASSFVEEVLVSGVLSG